MAHRTRALAALAAAALTAPLLPLTAVPALATPPEPPPVQPIADLCADVPADYDPFVDDEPNTFTAAIECVAFAAIANGGVGGRPRDQYSPALTVQRDQMASFIARTIDTADDLDTGDEVRALPAYDGSNAFSDVSSGSPHFSAINRLEAVGIVAGGPNGRPASQYGPELPVTRAQMASFINRAVAFMQGGDPSAAGRTTGYTTTNDFFTDDEGFTQHEANINGIASEGVVVGDGQDAYDPARSVPRDQMAGFLSRTLATLEEAGDITPVGASEPGPEPVREDIQVTPDVRAELLAIRNADSVATDDRSYTVAGLVAGQEYRITLVLEGNVTRNAAGEEVFAEDGTTGLAATGTRTADITRIDGQPAQNNDGDGTARRSVDAANGGTAVFTADTDGSSTFVVDGDVGGEAVLPVVYRNGGAMNGDEDGGQSARLELQDDGTADEAHDVGGATSFIEAANPTATVRPELASTGVVRSFSNAGSSAPGDEFDQTEVRFTFDEVITGKTPAAGSFHLVTFDGTRFNGQSAVVEPGGRSVLVTFGEGPGPSTGVSGRPVGAAQVQDLSLATVDGDAVRDVSGAPNPVGDDVIGTTRTETTGTAGRTAAPDLQTVGGLVSPAGEASTRVTFTFDQAAFTVTPSGFHVVTPNSQDITCTALAGQAGGQPAATEQADPTVEVSCPEAVLGRDITSGDIARAYVVAGTVSSARSDGNPATTDGSSNPLQATDTPDAGTTTPDLVRVRFDTTPTSSDQAIYTFDEEVVVLNDTQGVPPDTDTDGDRGQGDFSVYRSSGASGTAASTAALSETDRREVVVTFPNDALTDAVGAAVREGAVMASSGVENRANQEDEVGVGTATEQTLTAGRTSGPDLLSVSLTTDGKGVYTFDEDVVNDTTTMTGTANNVVEAELLLVLADGTLLECVAATAGAATTSEADTVTCAEYDVVITDADATLTQVRSAVLGTVDDGAVRDSGGGMSPEGAELTTGGTGTPQQ